MLRTVSVGAAALLVLVVGPTAVASADPDTTPPVVTITGYPASNETSGTFVFSANEPVQGYECRLDNDAFVACVTPTLVLGLVQGPHEFRVRAKDLAGNENDPAALYSWVVDLVAPSPPLITTPTSGTWTNATQPTISGIAEPLAIVHVFDDTTLLGFTTASGLGGWSLTPATPLAPGGYSIRARARDAANNQSGYSTVRTLHIDTTPPEAPTIVDPSAGEPTNSLDLSFAGATEPFAVVAVSIDSQAPETATANAAGQWSLDPVLSPADGPHAAVATSTDRAGNIGPASTAVNFELESTPPAQPVILTPTTGTTQTDGSVTFTGTAEASSAISLLDGSNELATSGGDSNGDWSVSFDLADGAYSIAAVATDAHGNESIASVAIDLTVDTVVPTTMIGSAFSVETDQRWKVPFAADEDDVTFTCSLDDAPVVTCGSPFVADGLSYSTHTLAVRAEDAAGNIEPTAASVSWRVVMPRAPILISPICNFESIVASTPVSVSGMRLGRSKGGRQTISLIADLPGIARVAIVRRGRELKKVSFPIAQGKNSARLPVRRLRSADVSAAGLESSLVVSTVSTTGVRSVWTRTVIVNAKGAARLVDTPLKSQRTKCTTPKDARPTKLTVLSTRRVGAELTVRVRSSQLALATARVSDDFSSVQAAVTLINRGRAADISVTLPPGLGDGPTAGQIVITAFNTDYARAQLVFPFPLR